MKITKSLYDDLFLESHNPLAIKCIQTLSNTENFIVTNFYDVIELTNCEIQTIINHNPHYKRNNFMLKIIDCNVDYKDKINAYFYNKNILKCVVGSELYNIWDNERNNFIHNVFSLSISKYSFQ